MKSALSPDLPWPGAAPYGTADRAYFHGRKRETEELLRLIQRDVLTLVTGAAGVGKTSLIQAGLLPALAESEWLPVVPHLDWSATPSNSDAPDLDPDAAVSLENPLAHRLIESLLAVAAERNFTSPEPQPGETLWEYFHRTSNRWWSTRQRVVTPIIIIDGFESVFTTATENATAERHAAGFLKELSQLAANRPPQRLATRLANGTASEDAYDFEPVPLRIVLVMRDEFVPQLTRLRPLFPTLRRSELRLEAFTTSQARDVLVRGSLQAGIMSDAALDAVVTHLASDRPSASEISPAKLSVLAHSLAAMRTERGVKQITPDFLNDADKRVATVAAPPIGPSVENKELREKLASSERRRRTNQRLALVAVLTTLVAIAAPVVRDQFASPKKSIFETAPSASRSVDNIPSPPPATPRAPGDSAAFENSFSVATPEFLPSAPAHPTPAPIPTPAPPEPAPKPPIEPGFEEPPSHEEKRPAPLPELDGQLPEPEFAPNPATAKPRPATPASGSSALSPEAQRQLNAATAERKEQQRREFLRRQQDSRRTKEAAPQR